MLARVLITGTAVAAALSVVVSAPAAAGAGRLRTGMTVSNATTMLKIYDVSTDYHRAFAYDTKHRQFCLTDVKPASKPLMTLRTPGAVKSTVYAVSCPPRRIGAPDLGIVPKF